MLVSEAIKIAQAASTYSDRLLSKVMYLARLSSFRETKTIVPHECLKAAGRRAYTLIAGTWGVLLALPEQLRLEPGPTQFLALKSGRPTQK